METNQINRDELPKDLFKIDLIVWKPARKSSKSSRNAWFKIDLIVWKPHSIEVGCEVCLGLKLT